MQTVQVITTGGTIEKAYSEQSGAMLNTTNKIGQYLKLLRLPGLDVHVTPLMNKDSLEMSNDDRAGLVAKVGELLPSNQPIVITHGTDTMVESGLAIERAFPTPPVPIILTGAMSPLGFEKSDGLQNLTESLFAARLLKPGVFIVIHGQVFPVAHVRKDRERGTFVLV
ncbi:MAG TPA: asparaginase [Terracidiphilus sp.]|nr:asparaginase [Terracidiphilus sp.]